MNDGALDPKFSVKFTVNPQQVAELLVKLSLDQVDVAPQQIILDMDVTNDEIYGDQEQGFFNAYYG